MTLTRQLDPTPDPPTLESNLEPTTREKSTTAARVAISSGPAVSTAEARKAKRKRNKLLPQAEEPTAAPESGSMMPPPPSPPSSAAVTQAATMAPNTPPMTQPSLAPPHPQANEPNTTQEADIGMSPPPPSPPPSTPITPVAPDEPEHPTLDAEGTSGALPPVGPRWDSPSHDTPPAPE
ncbi:hypothetical protein EDB89DRAFT_2061921 [Lactarius sanguifluus]|nr:hypothetical protein EDB89DRAFT_2061921 [Lactarius sanguifluus]